MAQARSDRDDDAWDGNCHGDNDVVEDGLCGFIMFYICFPFFLQFFSNPLTFIVSSDRQTVSYWIVMLSSPLYATQKQHKKKTSK